MASLCWLFIWDGFILHVARIIRITRTTFASQQGNHNLMKFPTHSRSFLSCLWSLKHDASMTTNLSMVNAQFRIIIVHEDRKITMNCIAGNLFIWSYPHIRAEILKPHTFSGNQNVAKNFNIWGAFELVDVQSVATNLLKWKIVTRYTTMLPNLEYKNINLYPTNMTIMQRLTKWLNLGNIVIYKNKYWQFYSSTTPNP